ncbi:MAG: alpha/beta hydrolase family esterase [Geminicoccaceae bacterium]
MLHRIVLAFAFCTFGLAAADATAAAPSPGCGAPPERPPGRFHVAGRERPAIVVLPEAYRANRPHALVFAFHGRTNDNVQARRYFGLEEAANVSTIYVYPAALADRTGRFTWADPGDPPDALRDFALFDVILHRIASAYCIDLGAVYVVGHSLGASFANSLACARAHRIRGVAAVAGGITPSDCSGAVAALLLHNPHDRAVPLSEGQSARDVLLGHRGDEGKWVRRRIGGFECRRYGDKEDPLFWCLHAQDVTPRGRFYPHQWPEGATRGIIAFFDMLVG